MDSVLGYSCTFFVGGAYQPPSFADFSEQVAHFHEILESLARHLEEGTPFKGITAEALLHALSPTQTHVGQLAMLRRLAASPVPPENFMFANITPENLTPVQPLPARPDKDWPKRL
jgi:hypothetical protein